MKDDNGIGVPGLPKSGRQEDLDVLGSCPAARSQAPCGPSFGGRPEATSKVPAAATTGIDLLPGPPLGLPRPPFIRPDQHLVSNTPNELLVKCSRMSVNDKRQ